MRLSRLLRNRVIGLARRVRTRVAAAGPHRAPDLELSTVQRRIELLLRAMYGDAFADNVSVTAVQANDTSIVLPRSIPDDGHAAERYRIMAVEQGARISRGSRDLTPADPLERDLYQIIEAANIDADLVARAPGLSTAIARIRREELNRRVATSPTSGQRPVEMLLRELLGAHPSAPLPSIPRAASPAASVEAARALANGIRRGMKKAASYDGMELVPIWDHKNAGRLGAENDPLQQSDTFLQSSKNATHRAESPNADSDASATRDAGRAENDAGAPVADDEVSFSSNDQPAVPAGPAPGGIQYPEWVERFKRLEPRYATVFDIEAPKGDAAWAREALSEHANLTRQLRDRFSLLRARRLRMRAQRSGEEIDLDACVEAFVDLRRNRVPSDRLYQTTRSSRQPLAITILVDVSGSTQESLPDGRRVIDLERLSVILASEALSSLGDPYSILAFSGNSRHSVRIATLKGFAERDLGGMHARISNVEPRDNTRLGAAVRHASSLLLRQKAHRHVLLILSDGKPHDVDWYWHDAAIEDSRIALLDARSAGVHSFCITVDTKEAEYLPHLFGEGRYWVLDDPADLPKALIRLIDTILKA